MDFCSILMLVDYANKIWITFKNLVRNHLAYFNQTWHECSLDDHISKLGLTAPLSINIPAVAKNIILPEWKKWTKLFLARLDSILNRYA